MDLGLFKIKGAICVNMPNIDMTLFGYEWEKQLIYEDNVNQIKDNILFERVTKFMFSFFVLLPDIIGIGGEKYKGTVNLYVKMNSYTGTFD